MVRILPQALVAIFLLGPFAPCTAATMERAGALGPRQLVQQTTKELLTAVNREKEAIRQDSHRASVLVDEILSPHIDYERIARLVLGRYWRQTTPEQRKRFVDEFRALQLRTYAAALTDYTHIQIEYLPLRHGTNEDDVMVRTRVPREGAPPIGIDYRLHRTNDEWKVYDVLVEGVSLLATFRTTFAIEIKKVGIDGLIDQIANKNR